MTRNEFVQKYSPLVKELSQRTGLFPELVFAQAFIESSDSKGNFGNSYPAKYGNNFFSIKPGAAWNGRTIRNPNVTSESNIFRAYASPGESIKDYFIFLTSNPRYRKAGVFVASNVAEQAKALQDAGYAGSSRTYAQLITKVADGAQKLLGVAKQAASDYEAYIAGALVIGGIIYFGTRKG